MLYMFRYTFGDDNPPGKPLGGWDNATTKLRGHATGHYLSAYQETGRVGSGRNKKAR